MRDRGVVCAHDGGWAVRQAVWVCVGALYLWAFHAITATVTRRGSQAHLETIQAVRDVRRATCVLLPFLLCPAR